MQSDLQSNVNIRDDLGVGYEIVTIKLMINCSKNTPKKYSFIEPKNDVTCYNLRVIFDLDGSYILRSDFH